MVKTLLRNWKISLTCISSLINYDLVTPFFFPFPPNLSWPFSINNIPEEPVRSSAVLESFMLSRCSMQCYWLLFQVPGWFSLAASNTLTELCSGSALWWEVVLGVRKYWLDNLICNLMLIENCSASTFPVPLTLLDFSWEIVIHPLCIRYTSSCSQCHTLVLITKSNNNFHILDRK